MADQNADTVAITGGTATLSSLSVTGNSNFGDGSTDIITITGKLRQNTSVDYGNIGSLVHSGAQKTAYAIGDFTTASNDTGLYLRTTGTGWLSSAGSLAFSLDGGGSSTLTMTSGGFSIKSTSSFYVNSSSGYLGYSGGSSAALGAAFFFYGESHAANANEWHLRNDSNTTRMKLLTGGDFVQVSSGKIGYGTGSGGSVTQGTSRTTGVPLNKTNGSITLVSAAGSTTWQSFTLTNSTIAATDVVIVNQKSGTDKYIIHVTAVAAGSCQITFATTGGTTTEQPVFNFAVIKGVTS